MYSKKFEIREHAGAVFSFAKDRSFLYSASADKFVTRWNKDTGVQDTFVIKCENSIYKIFHFPDNDILIIGTSKGDIHVVDSQTKKEIKFIKYHQVAIFEIQFNPLTRYVYIGDADGNLSVWDSENWDLVITLPFECGKIRTIIFTQDYHFLIFGSQDGNVRVLDNKTFNLVTFFKAHEGGCLSLLHCNNKQNVLFSSGKDGFIKAWDIRDFKLILGIPAHNEAIYKITDLNDVIISVSRDKQVKFWKINTLDFLFKIERNQRSHSHSINDILVLDNQFFTAGDDKRIICWHPNF
jgi:WD40 repeat protein